MIRTRKHLVSSDCAFGRRMCFSARTAGRRISELVLSRKVGFSGIGQPERVGRNRHQLARTAAGSRKFKSVENRSRILKTRVRDRTSEIDPKPRLQQQAGQNQQIEAGDQEVDVLLKVGPAFPGAASDSEDSSAPRDAAFDAGPKVSQFPVHSTGAHHLIDLQPAFLGRGDILDPLLLGPR